MQTQLQSWVTVQILELETSQRGKEKSRCFFKMTELAQDDKTYLVAKLC